MPRLIDADALAAKFMGQPPDYYHTSQVVGEITAAPTVMRDMDEFTRTARMIREARPLVFKGTVGYDFCVCENCRQKVDAHDVYCRQCGRVLVKGVDDNASETGQRGDGADEGA